MSTREIQIDGVTGNPIGTVGTTYTTETYQVGSGLVSSNPVGYTTTSHYVQPATTTTTYVQPTTTTTQYVVQQPVTSTQYVSGGYYQTQGSYVGGAVSGGVAASNVTGQQAQVVNTVVNTKKEVIKGESRIEYVPF